jgi:hypothetical protein
LTSVNASLAAIDLSQDYPAYLAWDQTAKSRLIQLSTRVTGGYGGRGVTRGKTRQIFIADRLDDVDSQAARRVVLGGIRGTFDVIWS